MDVQTLLTHYQQIDAYFSQKYPKLTGDYRILARLGKITEELGELNSAVHSELNLQRAEKQATHSFQELEKEWADVFNTVMLFAVAMGIKPEPVLKSRLQEIFKRYDLKETV